MIYLKHPIHGVKIASLEAEAKYDETKGWTRFDPSEPRTPSPDPATQLNPVAAALVADPPRKRGRPRKEH